MTDSDEKLVPVASGIERRREERLARLRDLEDEILERSCRVVDAAMAWGEVTFDQALPPREWVDKHGEREAQQRLQIAKATWMPASVAPVGLKLAVQLVVGIGKARGARIATTNNQLNVQICLPAPTSKEHPGPEQQYEVIDVDP